MHDRTRMSLEDFHQTLREQGVAAREDYAFVCPMCDYVQSARDLIAAGAGADFAAVEKFLGFSCVGRWLGAGSPMSDDSSPCNWTLGGLFQTHTLEIVMPDGEIRPRFAPAAPEEAQAHAARWAERRA